MRILTLAILVISLLLISSCTIKTKLPYEDEEVGVVMGASGSLYSCPSRSITKYCDTLSSTGKTCYFLENNIRKNTLCSEGWVLQSQPQPVPVVVTIPQNNYHCYPEKGYCRLNGLLTNPTVPIGQIK